MPRQYLQDFDIPIILQSAIEVNKISSILLRYSYFILLSRCCELGRCRLLLLCCSYYCVAAAASACCAAVVVCRMYCQVHQGHSAILPSIAGSIGNIAKYCQVTWQYCPLTRQYCQVLPSDSAILPSDLAILPSHLAISQVKGFPVLCRLASSCP
jgi:hypothetical protein